MTLRSRTSHLADSTLKIYTHTTHDVQPTDSTPRRRPTATRRALLLDIISGGLTTSTGIRTSETKWVRCAADKEACGSHLATFCWRRIVVGNNEATDTDRLRAYARRRAQDP